MTQEDKELLLVDLCARLPYGIAVELDEKFGFNKGTHVLVKELLDLYCVEGIKPYLRPLSSMTEEEYNEMFQQLYSAQEEFFRNCNNADTIGKTITYDLIRYDWLNKKMFDYRGLIPKDLAIEAPEGMYN